MCKSTAEKKDKKREEMLSHAKMPISSGVIEGCMNKIKVIKRTAFGFRYFDYFFKNFTRQSSRMPESIRK